MRKPYSINGYQLFNRKLALQELQTESTIYLQHWLMLFLTLAQWTWLFLTSTTEAHVELSQQHLMIKWFFKLIKTSSTCGLRIGYFHMYQTSNWFRTEYDLKDGDIVLFLKKDSTINKIHEYGKVKSVEKSSEDIIRKLRVKYRNANESIDRETYQ